MIDIYRKIEIICLLNLLKLSAIEVFHYDKIILITTYFILLIIINNRSEHKFENSNSIKYINKRIGFIFKILIKIGNLD